MKRVTLETDVLPNIKNITEFNTKYNVVYTIIDEPSTVVINRLPNTATLDVQYILDLLPANVVWVYITFSGGGDSGGIDSIVGLTEKSEEVDLCPHASGFFEHLVENRIQSLGDWWNGSGGSGSVIIDVKTGRCAASATFNTESTADQSTKFNYELSTEDIHFLRQNDVASIILTGTLGNVDDDSFVIRKDLRIKHTADFDDYIDKITEKLVDQIDTHFEGDTSLDPDHVQLSAHVDVSASSNSVTVTVEYAWVEVEPGDANSDCWNLYDTDEDSDDVSSEDDDLYARL